MAAGHAGATMTLHRDRAPMLLTIDALGRVLEFEPIDLKGTGALIASHVSGS